jgi:hypothetical protein
MNLCKSRSLKHGTCLSLFNNLSKTAKISFKFQNLQFVFSYRKSFCFKQDNFNILSCWVQVIQRHRLQYIRCLNQLYSEVKYQEWVYLLQFSAKFENAGTRTFMNWPIDFHIGSCAPLRSVEWWKPQVAMTFRSKVRSFFSTGLL